MREQVALRIQLALPSFRSVPGPLAPKRAVQHVAFVPHGSFGQLPGDLFRLQVVVRIEELHPVTIGLVQDLIASVIATPMIASDQPHSIAEFLDSANLVSEPDRSDNTDALRAMAATIILTHHEKWNGSGYPRRLSGDAIPIAGQVVAVADVYDALRSSRPYKKPFSIEETLQQMQRGRGSHFSPLVYDAFAGIVNTFEAIRDRFAEHEDGP